MTNSLHQGLPMTNSQNALANIIYFDNEDFVSYVSNMCGARFSHGWLLLLVLDHCSGVIMSTITPQITAVPVVCLTVCSGGDQRKHQSSTSLAFVRGINRWPVDSPHKGPVTPEWIGLSSHQTMSCWQFSTEPLPGPVMNYCQLGFYEQILVTL